MTALAAPLTTDRPTSPLQIELSFVLQVPPAEAFDLMAHRLDEWFTQIHAISWDHSKSLKGPTAHGACSERSCDFGGKALREVIVSYEPGKRYSYRADMARSEMKMPLDDHLGSFDFEAVPGGTRVTWRQHFAPKWFVPGAMLRWQMRDKMMRPAVERLFTKYGGRWA
jgi:hypothetical protein